MELDFSSQSVLVTGSSLGIGRVIADRFAAEGAHVFGLDIAPPVGAEGWAGSVVCDVTDEEAVAGAISAIENQSGAIHVLVNNAGINVVGPVEELTAAQWRRCLDVNVVGVAVMCAAVIPGMKRAGRGAILNAASFAAINPSVGAAAYAASKAAVVQMTRVIAGELGPWGITVNAYAPGMVPTAMNGFADMTEAAKDELLDTLTLRRWQSPDDVADLLLFLASDRARYITGTLVDVSGGKLSTQIPRRAYDWRDSRE
jgi:NAD(P)-dependent dehydrogenase (short-subunit alcohol dehydrogenase family)